MPKHAVSWKAVFAKFSKNLGLAGMIAPAVLLAASTAWGAEGDDRGREAGSDRAIRLLTLAPVPPTAVNNTAGAMYSFDISWVDQATQTYYLADRSNVTVDVVDAKTGTFTKQLNASPPFRGFVPCVAPGHGANDCAGPNGVVHAEAPLPWLFVTDAGSRVVTINAVTGATVSDVVTNASEATRADELAYAPELGLLLVINNAASPPFGTLIKVNKATGALTVGKNIILDAGHGVDAQNGAEQPVWDPDTGRFYLSIPQVGSDVSVGGVARINPMSAAVETVFPVKFCGPAGLALGPHQDLFIGCNMVFDTAGNVWDPTKAIPADPRDVIIDAKTGKKDADVFGVGAGDEVWFNHGDGNYYATGSGSPLRPLPSATAQGATPLGVVDSRDQSVLQLLTTYNVPAVTTGAKHPAGTSHSVAANAANNLVFVPLAGNNTFLSPDASKNCLTGCIAVFGHPDESTK